jgi:hypothetical protein
VGDARQFKNGRQMAAFLGIEVVPNVCTGFSDFLACLFPYQAAFNKFCSWHISGVMPPKAV